MPPSTAGARWVTGARCGWRPLGAWFADDLHAVVAEARGSAQVTHMHAEGQAGAVAVAAAAAMAWRMAAGLETPSGSRLLESVIARTPSSDTREGLERAAELPGGTTVSEAVSALGNGSRVISSDTVPFALWCAARHLFDYEEAMWTTVSGLGDRDTTCAIVGGIVALSAGPAAIPPEWLAAREPLGLAKEKARLSARRERDREREGRSCCRVLER